MKPEILYECCVFISDADILKWKMIKPLTSRFIANNWTVSIMVFQIVQFQTFPAGKLEIRRASDAVKASGVLDLQLLRYLSNSFSSLLVVETLVTRELYNFEYWIRGKSKLRENAAVAFGYFCFSRLWKEGAERLQKLIYFGRKYFD